MPFPTITRGRPALVLAPMDGLTDRPVRALLSGRGGFTFCVSEFLRVAHQVPPAHVYRKHVPEIDVHLDGDRRCVTPSGTPVQLQLLGGDPERLARAAELGVQLGARAIDLNFGCPAATVNRHDGGATLLKHPERLEAIVRAVRDRLPPTVPVSAKLRLGWDDMSAIHDNARRAEQGGANWITIHARTRAQGYTPPAHWHYIGQVRQVLSIPIVANGDLWTRQDFLRCREVTGAEHFMVGRGALADPSLPQWIAWRLGVLDGDEPPEHAFLDGTPGQRDRWWRLLAAFAEQCRVECERDRRLDFPFYAAQRAKQWLKYAHSRHGLPLFDEIKRLDDIALILAHLDQAA